MLRWQDTAHRLGRAAGALLLCATLAASAPAQPAPVETHAAPSAAFVAENQAWLDALFARLDERQPALQPALAHWRAGDLAAACAELLRYYREKPAPHRDIVAGWHVALPRQEPRLTADALLRDEVTIQGLTAKLRRLPDGGIDWLWRGPADDPEWAWMINRHGPLLSLVTVWKQTRDPRYADCASRWLVDWLRTQPYPGRITFSPPWRALEAARRSADTWPVVFTDLQAAPEFSDEARLRMLASIPDHAALLEKHASFWGGNHLLTEKVSLARLAAVWPEFRDAPAWMRHAAEAVERELLDQTYPDGAFKELTNHYQRVALLSAQNFDTLLRSSAQADEYPALTARIQAMWRYFVGIAKPDGCGPINSASDEDYNLLIALDADGKKTRVPGLPDSLVQEGFNRPPRSQYFPWAGHAIMRGDTGPRAQWAFFDIGPHGSDHQHQDRLNLAVFAEGRDILIDPGRYTYQPGPWFDFFNGPRGHNILLLDGQGSLPPPRVVDGTPMPACVRQTPDWDYFAAGTIFPAGLWRGHPRWTRGVLYFHAIGWIVIDEVEAFGPTQVETLWHFAPGLKIESGQATIRASDAEGRAFVLTPALTQTWETQVACAVSEPQPAGWFSPRYNEKLPAPEVTCTTRIARPTRFVWLLTPDRAGAGQLSASTDKTGAILLRATKPDGTTQELRLDDLLDGPTEMRR